MTEPLKDSQRFGGVREISLEESKDIAKWEGIQYPYNSNTKQNWINQVKAIEKTIPQKYKEEYKAKMNEIAQQEGDTLPYPEIQQNTNSGDMASDKSNICINTPNEINHEEDFFTVGNFVYTIISKEQQTVALDGFEWGKEHSHLIIPSSVEYKGKRYSVISIEQGCFSDKFDTTYYYEVSSVSLPNFVINIGHGAFEGCCNMTRINFPSSIEEIGENAFAGCSKLTKADFGARLKSIGSGAFMNCTGLTEVIFRSQVASIGKNAFSACLNLKCVSLPKSLKIIPNMAFFKCESLASITIPDSTKSIKRSAFSECIKLKTVTIGYSVNIIGDSAFKGCTELREINVRSIIPPKLHPDAFKGVRNEAIIYVPFGCLDIYKQNWSYFSNFQEDKGIDKKDLIEDIVCNGTRHIIPINIEESLTCAFLDSFLPISGLSEQSEERKNIAVNIILNEMKPANEFIKCTQDRFLNLDIQRFNSDYFVSLKNKGFCQDYRFLDNEFKNPYEEETKKYTMFQGTLGEWLTGLHHVEDLTPLCTPTLPYSALFSQIEVIQRDLFNPNENKKLYDIRKLLSSVPIFLVTRELEGKDHSIINPFSGETVTAKIPVSLDICESGSDALGMYVPRNGAIYLWVDKIYSYRLHPLIFQKVLLHELIHFLFDIVRRSVPKKKEGARKEETSDNNEDIWFNNEETLDNYLVLLMYKDAISPIESGAERSFANIKDFISKQPSVYMEAIDKFDKSSDWFFVRKNIT